MNKHDREVYKAIEEKFKAGFKKQGKKWSPKLDDERFSSKTYWDYVEKGEGFETDPVANPDLLNDESVKGRMDLAEAQKLQLRAIKQADLTAQQRLIVYLIGEREMTQADAAEYLHIKRTTLQKQLERAREKIQETYESLSSKDGF